MAWLQQYASGHFHVSFRLAGRKFKRSLDTKSESVARAMAGRIEENIKLVERGILTMPPGADIPTFLLSDGKMAGPVEIELPNGGVVRLPLGIGQVVLVEVIRAVGALRPWKAPKS